TYWEEPSIRTIPIDNPATGQITGDVAMADTELVDKAVQYAKKAAKEWGSTSLAKRTQIIINFRNLLNERKSALAEIITREHGKVLSDAEGEISRGLEVVEFSMGISHLMKGGFSENVSTGIDVYSIRQSLGVVAVIS